MILLRKALLVALLAATIPLGTSHQEQPKRLRGGSRDLKKEKKKNSSDDDEKDNKAKATWYPPTGGAQVQSTVQVWSIQNNGGGSNMPNFHGTGATNTVKEETAVISSNTNYANQPSSAYRPVIPKNSEDDEKDKDKDKNKQQNDKNKKNEVKNEKKKNDDKKVAGGFPLPIPMGTTVSVYNPADVVIQNNGSSGGAASGNLQPVSTETYGSGPVTYVVSKYDGNNNGHSSGNSGATTTINTPNMNNVQTNQNKNGSGNLDESEQCSFSGQCKSGCCVQVYGCINADAHAWMANKCL